MQIERKTSLGPEIIPPLSKREGDAGYDLRTCIDFELNPGERQNIPSGFAIALPEGTYGRIAPRSGLASTLGIDVLAGVVDFNYRGEVSVVLVNHGDEPVSFAVGERIAQLVIEYCMHSAVEEVESIDSTGDRGTAGFGSTGRK